MYTIELLSAINPAYCYKHRVTQVDVDNVNHMVECIEKARENVSTPMEGDIIHYSDRYGIYYRNALLVKLDEFGDGKAEICFSPFGTRVSEQNGAIHVSASGGPFGLHQPEDFIYEGFEKRRFSIWGSCGPSESGCVEFEARVHLWSYREPNPCFGDYSTENWDMFYVSSTEAPANGSPYHYKVMEPGGTSRYAFGKRQKEYLSWLRTYRGVEFEGHYANQTVVFCYRKAEKLLSKEAWDALALPTDTRFMNCSVILVKVDYNDDTHTVTEYRYENKGESDGKPYRVALREVEDGAVKRVILPRSVPQTAK